MPVLLILPILPVSLRSVLCGIRHKFRRFAPVSDSPVLKVPLVGIDIALIVHIVQSAVLEYEVGWEVVYVGVFRV